MIISNTVTIENIVPNLATKRKLTKNGYVYSIEAKVEICKHYLVNYRFPLKTTGGYSEDAIYRETLAKCLDIAPSTISTWLREYTNGNYNTPKVMTYSAKTPVEKINVIQLIKTNLTKAQAEVTRLEEELDLVTKLEKSGYKVTKK